MVLLAGWLADWSYIHQEHLHPAHKAAEAMQSMQCCLQGSLTNLTHELLLKPSPAVFRCLHGAAIVAHNVCCADGTQVGRDSRPVMRAAYDCFRTQGCSPSTILQAAGPEQGTHDSFYALLYVGLWHEAHGDADKAQEAISKAVDTQYAKLSGDYMASLARVHCQRRGWPLKA